MLHEELIVFDIVGNFASLLFHPLKYFHWVYIIYYKSKIPTYTTGKEIQ